MRKLTAPDDSVRDVFSACIESYRDADLKNRLNSICHILVSDTLVFEQKMLTSQTHTIPSSDNIGGVVTSCEMGDVYDHKFVKGSGRTYYEKYLSMAINRRCPLCGIGFVSTLDHYLPKSKYPALAVTPKNLVPACRDCNMGAKRTFAALNSFEEPLHPYFDDVEQDIWLSVEFRISDNDLIPAYFVDKPTGWSELLFRRVENHMRLYNLYESYAVHASEEITSRFDVWKAYYSKRGAVGLTESFEEEASSREHVVLNSWQAALYRGLVAQIDIVCQWIQLQI